MSDLGRDYETSLDPSRRRRDGVHYTPRLVADELVARAFAPHRAAIASGAPFTVCDPTCGAGVFLVAAAEALVGAGRSPIGALASLRGMDIDPEAIVLAQQALCRWAQGFRISAEDCERHLQFVVGDALNDAWPEDGRIDVVVGNPPFGGQLAGATIRSESAVEGAARILGRPAGYTDTSGVLLVRALRAVRPGGSVVFVQPLSVLGSRDGTIVREAVGGALESIWIPDRLLFDAAVSVCAPIVRTPLSSAPVRSHESSSANWTELAADALGVPNLQLRGDALSSRALCTAGFRQEFYEIAAAVQEASSAEDQQLPRLVTVGLIDPGRLLWGERDAKVAGTTYKRPVVNISKTTTSRKVATVLPLRVQPKVLVATQTRVIEAVADHDGSLWPSVPVLSVLPKTVPNAVSTTTNRSTAVSELDLLLAALCAPPASVWAARQAVGTARSPGAIRLSASLLQRMPLPVDAGLWERGAEQLRDGALSEAVVTLTKAHGLSETETEAVLDWWNPRSVRRI